MVSAVEVKHHVYLVAAEGQMNVPADIHLPAEDVQPPESCDWSCNKSWQSAIGRATSRGDLPLVVQSVVTICHWSCRDYL